MADVQLEDGYTRVANEIFEECAKRKFNGTQLRILLVVWRYTYGFGRKDHEMSLTFFAKACELGKTQLDREITALIESNVLIVTQESTYTKPRKIGFNKNYEEWNIDDSQRVGGQSAKKLTVSEKVEEQSANKRTPTVSKKADQERNSFKENLKEIPYVEIVDYLNKIAGTNYRSSSKGTQRHIQARFNEKYTFDQFKTVIDKKCAEWLGTDMEQYLRPETLFGNKFENYLNQKIGLKGGSNGGKYGRSAQGNAETYRPDEDPLNDLYYGSPSA